MRKLLVFLTIVAVATAASIQPPEDEPELDDEPLEEGEGEELNIVDARSAKVSRRPDNNHIHNVEYKSEADKDGFKYSFKNDDGTQEREEGHFKAGPNNTVEQTVKGSYQYTDKKTGKSISVTYTADKNGYHPSGNVLPVAPPSPDYVLALLELLATAQPYEEKGNAHPQKGKGAPSKPAGPKNAPHPRKPPTINRAPLTIEKKVVEENKVEEEEEKNSISTGESVGEEDENLDDGETIEDEGDNENDENENEVF